jgi:1-deoxy-D-xylulose-5-phosphate synthase
MSDLLENINSPSDIKNFSLKELGALSKNIRKTIIETVAKTGGHLAPGLGVVELTLALHYVFDMPEDRIIWDVGHQCYAHKLITGRAKDFHTLRQQGGIAGFPKRSESIYDILDTGHSSTSISAALGMSCAMELMEKNGRVIAVIGDGSMTAGLAFEALNNTGHLQKDLIVVLNDNEMSISPNVGALSSFLSRKLTGPIATNIKKDMESFLKKTFAGEQILTVLKKSEESLKALFTPGMLFEAFQFNYIGPLPGHHLETLIQTFKNVKKLKGPVLVHVITKKGKGYLPAEEKPEKFHGTGPFDISTGKSIKYGTEPPTYTKIFSETLLRIATENPKVVAITAAMPSGTGLDNFATNFPDRFFDVGIAEQHAVTFAAGLALEGLIPVVAIYSTFLQRSFDQIIHDVCLNNLPVVFALDRGGLVGDDGPTHHGVFDISFLRLIPNIIIMSPRDENELQHMLFTATKLNCPVAIRYPRGNGIGVNRDWNLMEIPVGKGEILKQGDDLTIIASGIHCYTALDASEKLEKEGIMARVIDAKFIKPLDKELILEAAQQTGNIITIEENVRMGGFGSAILEMLSDEGVFDIKVRRIGIPDRFIQHGNTNLLRAECGLTAESIIEKAKELLCETCRSEKKAHHLFSRSKKT